MAKEKKIVFSKIVYFDEDTAIDSLEVIEEGQAAQVMHDLDEKAKNWGFNGGLSGFFKALNIGAEGAYQRQSNTVVEKQITTTILSRFISNVEQRKLKVIKAETPRLSIESESAAYYRNLMPVVNMIGDLDKISTEVIEDKSQLVGINFDGMREMLDTLFAYYELLGEYKGKKAIFRFNIDWLKNNYNLYDLVKMTDLSLYGVQVGTTSDSDLTFQKQVNKITDSVQEDEDNNLPIEFDDIKDKSNEKDKENSMNKKEKVEIPIIDIILAGIEQ